MLHHHFAASRLDLRAQRRQSAALDDGPGRRVPIVDIADFPSDFGCFAGNFKPRAVGVAHQIRQTLMGGGLRQMRVFRAVFGKRSNARYGRSDGLCRAGELFKAVLARFLRVFA